MTDTLERNKDVIRQLTTAWNERDREAMAAVYADELRVHGADPEVRSADRQLDGEETFFEAFPDIEATTEELLAEDDRVLVRWHVTGTHEGPLGDLEPTGESVEYEEWVVYTLDDGRIVEFRALSDVYSLYTQLGVVEPVN